MSEFSMQSSEDTTEDEIGNRESDVNLRKEQVGLVLRFIAIVVLTPLMAWMLTRMWQPGAVSYEALNGLANTVAVGSGRPISLIDCFGIGSFSGLLLLFTLDSRKRYQGALLIIGFLLGLGTLAFNGQILVNIDFSNVFNLGMLGFGFVTALAIEFPKLQDLYKEGKRIEPEDIVFQRAVGGVFVFLFLLAVVGLLDAIYLGVWKPFPDVPVTVAFLYFSFGFVTYESTANIAIIGPRESGKSLLLLGLYLRYRGMGIAMDADGYMDDLVTQADQMDTNDPRFPIAPTTHLESLSFKIVSGTYFPERIKISVTDFTGELLGRLSRLAEEEETLTDRVGTVVMPWKSASGSRARDEEQLLEFYQSLKSPKVLILLLDVERIVNGDLDHLRHLKTLGERARDNNAEVLVVASKCDLLIDEFVFPTNDPIGHGLGAEFEEDVTEFLTERFDLIDGIVDDIGNGRIYPVYYVTQEIEEDDEMGTLRPVLDDAGNLQHRGTGKVATAIESRL